MVFIFNVRSNIVVLYVRAITTSARKEPHLFYKQYWLHPFKTLLFVIKIINISRKGKKQQYFVNFLFLSMPHITQCHINEFLPLFVCIACRFVADRGRTHSTQLHLISEHSPFLLSSESCAFILNSFTIIISLLGRIRGDSIKFSCHLRSGQCCRQYQQSSN